MAQTTNDWPDGLFGLYQFKIDYGHNYTDAEIRDIIDTRGGLVRGTYEAWAYLAECATDPGLKNQCTNYALSAKWAEEF